MSVKIASSGKDPVYSKDFLLILCFYIFAILAEQMEANVYPVFLRSSGYSVSQTGVFSSVLNLTGCLCPLLFGGFLINRLRRSWAVLLGVLGEFLGAAGFLLLSLFSWEPTKLFFAVFLMLRLVQGVGYSVYFMAAMNLITEHMTDEQVLRRTSAYYNGGSVAAATGPALGLGLASAVGFGNTFVVMLVFLSAAAALAAVNLVRSQKSLSGVSSAVKAESAVEQTPSGAGKKGLPVFEKAALAPSLFMFYYEVVMGSVFSFIMLFSGELNLTNSGIFYTPYHICAIAMRSVMTRAIASFGKQNILMACVGVEGLGLLVAFRAGGMLSIIITGALLGAADGFCFSIINVAALTSVPEARRGAANATFLTFKGLGLACGSILWGFIGDMIGLRNIYLCASVLMLFALAGLFLYFKRRKAVKAAG
ncbi:MAG: MFS transporter [Oscillospiraceae bacterium]|nr:MFS transporter [Oscillospiraceae bacterium]